MVPDAFDSGTGIGMPCGTPNVSTPFPSTTNEIRSYAFITPAPELPGVTRDGRLTFNVAGDVAITLKTAVTGGTAFSLRDYFNASMTRRR